MRRKDIPLEIQELIENRTLEYFKDAKIANTLLSRDEWNLHGLFHFGKTPEGMVFWIRISQQDFSVYYDKYFRSKQADVIQEDVFIFPEEWWIESTTKEEQESLKTFFNRRFRGDLLIEYDKVGCTFGFFDGFWFYNISHDTRESITKITYRQFLDQFPEVLEETTKNEVSVPKDLIGPDFSYIPKQSDFIIEDMKDIPIKKKNIKFKFKIETFN